MVNRLKGKIQCLGFAIETKKLNTEEILRLEESMFEKLDNLENKNVDRDW